MSLYEEDFQALQAGVNQLNDQRAASQQAERNAKLKQLLMGEQINQAKKLRSEYGPNVGVNVEGVSIQPKDALRQAQLEALSQQRDEEAVRKLEKRSADANTATAVPALQRGEEAIPGIFTTPDKPATFKSVGGARNLAPTMVVPLLEKMGIMEKGAGKERSALNELTNVKIYDSSGKAISIPETQRIKEAMGLRGLFDPSEVQDALRQMGYTVLEKQKGVSAGAPERIVNKFKQAGGLAGASTLSELIGASAQSKASGAPPAPAAPQTKTVGGVTYVRTPQGWVAQ